MSGLAAPRRPSWAEIDVEAIEHNARVLVDLVRPAALCAVVKADGYGHGSVDVARAALLGGASALGVALVDEGMRLRDAGIEVPILVQSEPARSAMSDALAARLTPTLYSDAGVKAAEFAASKLERVVPVHVKIDTGMHRVGAGESEYLEIARRVSQSRELELEGFWTHFAVADDVGDPFTDVQLRRFLHARGELKNAGIAPRIFHAANTAGAIAHPASRFDWVRCGLALYGYLPSLEVAHSFSSQVGPAVSLVPALSLRSRVHLVRSLAAGERPSYGRVYELERDSRVVVVPLGYADGLPFGLTSFGAEVLIRGKRRRIAGRVTMDQVIVDIEDDASIVEGDEVVFIGRQGDEEITATEWAGMLDTIPYEVLVGIGARVPRVVVNAKPTSTGG